MNFEDAANILDGKTSRETLSKIEYYAGFRGGEARQEAIAEACQVAAWVLRHLKIIPGESTFGDPLTIEQLREMNGRPVWVEFEDGSGGLWGIVHLSIFEQIIFPNGLHCTIGQPYYGKTYKAYSYKPIHISCEDWVAEWKEYTGIDAGFHYCSKCGQQAFNYEDGEEIVEVLSSFCPSCARAMSSESLVELKKRILGCYEM